MKVLTVLLIVGCIGVHAIKDRTNGCFEQHGIDYGEITKMNITMKQTIEKITPYKMGCLTMCYLKNELEHDIPMKKHVIDTLNDAQKFADIFAKPEVDELKERANKCIIEAKEDECKLFECLRPWDSPIGNIIMR